MAGTGFKIGNPGDSCGCDCAPVTTFSCNSCQITDTVYVTDPVYGVTATLIAFTIAGNTTWSGTAIYPNYPGYAFAPNSPAPPATVRVDYVYNCATGTLRVQAGQSNPSANAGWPGSAAAPNFGLTGVLSPMSCSRLSFVCHGVGSFDSIYSGTSAGSFLMSNFFQVDTNQHVFGFAVSSVHP